MSTESWFLTAAERGNPFTRLTYRREGAAFSRGNAATALVHGVAYFRRLVEVVEGMRAGDLLLFTDWRGDGDELLTQDGPTISELLVAAARRGVDVRGLFWRSHTDLMHDSERNNLDLADAIRRAGGEVVLDQRVPPMGCHHQKFVVARHPGRPERDVAFVGGIDLCHTRRDDAAHRGDPQKVAMGAVWGDPPAWHDLMIQVQGPAVGDVEANFRERWEDPSSPAPDPLNRLDAVLHRDVLHPRVLPPQLPDPRATGGTHDVQVLRTFPPKLPRFPFAPEGERSVAHGYVKALARAESLVYLEDQYVWNAEVVSCFAEALRRSPRLRLIIVLSTYTTADTPIANASAMSARAEALASLRAAGGDRVGIYGIENAAGTPVYVHAKTCMVDDVWMTIGSDNVNLRSWTFDTELTCAVVDRTPDERSPRTVREDADAARRLPRDVRLELAREHLGREDDAGLVDPVEVFEAFRAAAAALDAWHEGGRRGERPPGQLRSYRAVPIPRRDLPLGRLVYHLADDPDGRPRGLRGTDTF